MNSTAYLEGYMAKTAEQLQGGKADGMSLEDIARKTGAPMKKVEGQAEIGREVEREHTSDPAIAEEILKDHLSEGRGFATSYYTKLKQLEDTLKKG